MSYYICGIGFVTQEAMGCGREFETFNTKSRTLSPIFRKDILDKPYKSFGRMDFFSKIGFAGIYFAYKDAGLIIPESMNSNKTSNTSILASTLYGCLDTDKDFFNTIKFENGKAASPALFAYTLPNTFLGEASIFLKATGESFVINKDPTNGITALKMSFDILDSEKSDFVLCGLCDTYNPPESLKVSTNYFAGSLFFTLSKKKETFCYGKLKENKNGDIFYKEKYIENLLDLAQACIKIKKNKLKE
ncbi:MAG: hypothetical protein KAI40_01550 [Desulfobacterales bacterium]|nr:hypothetical protein [Desulfobacterales bacterium]